MFVALTPTWIFSSTLSFSIFINSKQLSFHPIPNKMINWGNVLSNQIILDFFSHTRITSHHFSAVPIPSDRFILAWFPCYEKLKVKRSPTLLCVWVYLWIHHINFWMLETLIIKLGMYIKLNPSHAILHKSLLHSLWLYVYPLLSLQGNGSVRTFPHHQIHAKMENRWSRFSLGLSVHHLIVAR
jgi:hypothetical protein